MRKYIILIIVLILALTGYTFIKSKGKVEQKLPTNGISNTKNTIVFLGDSITAGYGVESNQAFPYLINEYWKENNISFVAKNEGISGDTTTGVLSRLDNILTDDVYMVFLEIGANDGSALEVEFKVKSDEIVPKFVLSLTQTGKLSKKDMPKTQYYELVQDYVCSCSIRIARDMMALLPVDKVTVHAVDNVLNTATGYIEEATILSVVFDRETLNRLNFDMIDPSDAIQNFKHNMKYLKTGGLKPVDRITE